MVDILSKRLDELMGKDRNKPVKICKEKIDLNDEEICKFFLISVCPYDFFPNTKYDMGECTKRHDQQYKSLFYQNSSLEKLKKEKKIIEEVILFYQQKIQIVDNKIKELSSQQDIALHRGEIPLEFQEKITLINNWIESILQEIELYGQQGEIEKVEELDKELQELRLTQKDLQLISVNPSLAQRQLKLCEICGAKQSINDIEKRNISHLEGKMHRGFEIIWKEKERLKNKLESLLINLWIKQEEKTKEKYQ